MDLKTSFVVFLIMVGLFIFEFVQYKKAKNKAEKPTIPVFDPNAPNATSLQNGVVSQTQQSSRKIPHGFLMIFFFLALLIFGGVSLSSGFMGNGTPSQPQSNVIVEEVSSKGIKAYSKDWRELTSSAAAQLMGGDSFYCAVETIPNTDIDRARIRVNKAVWDLSDITTQFNKQYNVYYRECMVATADAKLKMDGQLHSIKDGWLGE